MNRVSDNKYEMFRAAVSRAWTWPTPVLTWPAPASPRVLALAGIVETTGDAVVAARLDRTITAWNRGAENLFGWTAEEMLGQSVQRIVLPGDTMSLQSNLQQSMGALRLST